jgi:hypothetical protein
MASTRNKQRTYARTRAISRRGYLKYTESDGQYLLKLVFVILLGTVWIKFQEPFTLGPFHVIGIPVGLLFGMLMISRFEKQSFDRKIWYAILFVVTIVSLFAPTGIVI